MSLLPIPGFCGSSYLARARGISAARTINCLVEKSQDPSGTILAPVPIAKAPYFMYPRAGKKLFATSPTSPNAGAYSNGTRVFYATRGNVYELLQTGISTSFGAITVGSNPVTFRANGGQLVVCSGGNVFVSNGGPLYQPIIAYANATVDVTGTLVTWVAGDTFTLASGGSNVQPGDLVQLGATGITYEVVSVDPSGLSLTISVSAGTVARIRLLLGDSGFVTGAMVEFIDGYFIVNVPNTKMFRISNAEDGTEWDELDFGEKSGSTDNIAAIASVWGNLVLLGDTNSTEVWGDSGSANFPFARISGTTLSVGANAPWSVGKMPDGSIIWLMSADGGNGILVQSSGGLPQRISNYYFEDQVRKYARTDDAIASTYIENGHSLYRIDFPTANRTWFYDANTGTITEMGIESPMDEVYYADPAFYNVHVTWPNPGPNLEVQMHLGFDYKSGKIWQIDPDFLDDDGVDFPVMRIAPHINSNLEWTECNEFALDCEMGTIDPTAVGPDGKELIPTVSMFWSDDGGRTWNDAGAASLGRVGEYAGTYLGPGESFDHTPNSQTNPQAFEPEPSWKGLGSFWVSRTFKIKSTGRMLRAVYNGLASINPGTATKTQ